MIACKEIDDGLTGVEGEDGALFTRQLVDVIGTPLAGSTDDEIKIIPDGGTDIDGGPPITFDGFTEFRDE